MAFKNRRRRWAFLLAAVLLPVTTFADEPLVLLLQPLMHHPAEQGYRPLTQHLKALTGHDWVVQAPTEFVVYWETLRRNAYDLALDAPHFTDYRARKFGFTVLAKVPDTLSYSLLVRADQRIADPTTLANKRIVTLGFPHMGPARLQAIFPNPLRQPVVIETADAVAAIESLLSQKADAALLPATFVSERMEQGGLTVVLSTEPLPQLALSASPRLSSAMQNAIRDGFLEAHKNMGGRKMLQILGVDRFEPATAELFLNQGNILKSYWGY
ncbi:MAG: PhnD/SsuA/transferrin family substrate-binding protein [Gammaproteobacteria bacterium]|nr:PhnD/SsuA/transferrin family substrate-binding protein [Gammaproteobacteria bacterium]